MGGNIPAGNFVNGNFTEGDFPGGSLMGLDYPGRNFPGENFPRTVLEKKYQSNFPLFILMSIFLHNIYIIFKISIMKPIICKYRVLLDCESTSYELRANKPAVESVPFWANGPASYQVNSLWKLWTNLIRFKLVF